MNFRRALNRAFRWLRQLVCIHGPLEWRDHESYTLIIDKYDGLPYLERSHRAQFCLRCGKIVCKEVQA